jgi:hypothetical protein
MRCFLRAQDLPEGFDARLGQGLSMREGCEYRQGGGQAGIGKDLRELGEEHYDQGLELSLRGCCLSGSRCVCRRTSAR